MPLAGCEVTGSLLSGLTEQIVIRTQGFRILQTLTHTGGLVSPIEALEGYLQKGGVTILQAAFEQSFFVDPDDVLAKSPWFPGRARTSRRFYPDKGRGDKATWKGQEVTLGDNTYAQEAWQKYTGRRIYRGSGYGVRHIWGHPWNPDAFTAGWNLCYMPFWAGMLTEDQHPHPRLQEAVMQASWDLFFLDNPVCTPPDFVRDPGLDLGLCSPRSATPAARQGIRNPERSDPFSRLSRPRSLRACQGDQKEDEPELGNHLQRNTVAPRQGTRTIQHPER